MWKPTSCVLGVLLLAFAPCSAFKIPSATHAAAVPAKATGRAPEPIAQLLLADAPVMAEGAGMAAVAGGVVMILTAGVSSQRRKPIDSACSFTPSSEHAHRWDAQLTVFRTGSERRKKALESPRRQIPVLFLSGNKKPEDEATRAAGLEDGLRSEMGEEAFDEAMMEVVDELPEAAAGDAAATDDDSKKRASI
jgi:hypothetical protein